MSKKKLQSIINNPDVSEKAKEMAAQKLKDMAETKVTKDDFTRVKSDMNGNPRYVISYYHLLTKEEEENAGGSQDRYNLAIKKAKKIGGRKYTGKDFGGGIVFQSYNLNEEVKRINEMKGISSEEEKKEKPKTKSGKEVMSELKAKKDSRSKKPSIEESYYKRELSNVDLNSEYAPTLKIKGGEKGETKTLNINKESAPILINWLETNFNSKSNKEHDKFYIMKIGEGKSWSKWSAYRLTSDGLKVVWPGNDILQYDGRKVDEEAKKAGFDVQSGHPKFMFKIDEYGTDHAYLVKQRLEKMFGKNIEVFSINGSMPNME